MDCQTARHLLGLASACGPDDAAALDAHLAECGGCAGFAAAQAGFDAAVAAAMRSVPLPAGGAERAVRLASMRRASVVRRRVLTGVAVGLAVLLAGPVGYRAFLRTRPAADAAELAQSYDYLRDDPERFAGEWLAAQGLPPTLPHRFDYRHLLDVGRFDLNGRPTPCLLFANGRERLKVFVLPRHQFRPAAQPAQGSFATVQPVPEAPEHPGVSYLLLYTSPTLDPFLLP